ncbi:hypothetical protein AMTRI_Chr10g5340 [Amborella trichopoda]|uniref:Uncharacterized protein n=1 Tax=Amborella trichopoda TaxID=13333 RepID=U5D7Q4_AMBTC|nr:protein TORNADO 1 [Amborella trichopoda]XP_020530765.1 protein TORNADO 1 [Amborella trichopoda]XP_020530766.1 protein TORNADO 1 [Amborella trichopoda]ERN18270.1 hypothetical protein AMTR_s00055p00138540 [Amborella trichopoda]|eukprot:XP_006856803.1 protein TORNADO 1 [Amborella trichopoda]
MASRSNFKNIEWAIQALQNSENLNLQTISFYHCQTTSNCYQETETSLTINISDERESHNHFSLLLSALSSPRKKTQNSALKTMEFHWVQWETPEQLNSLCKLLEPPSTLRQLVFHRNSLDSEWLSKFSEMLGESRGLKEIIFSESRIGCTGATMLASSLKRNESLEELQIWDDSIGSKGAEELSKMIEVNSTLKLLIILDSQSLTATPLISAVLARNRLIELHVWNRENREKNTKVVEFIPENSALRIYRLNLSGSCRVAGALGYNSTVRSLDLTGIQLKSKWAKEFRNVLEENRSLKHINLSKTRLKDKGVVYIAAGLFMNQSLETLILEGNIYGGIGIEHLLCPLSRFSATQNQANLSLKCLFLGGKKTNINRVGMAAILRMLATNQSLVKLGICEDTSLRSHDFIRAFRALERNTTLKCLSLRGCRGVEGESLFQAIMDTLEVNPWIEDIDLSGTPLQSYGKTEAIYKKLGQNGRIESEVGLLHDMPMTKPKSCRVFLFGQEFAGKTTLCNSMVSAFTGSKLPYLDQIKTLANSIDQITRTEGVKIKTFKDDDSDISIWDVPGQPEFHAFHDLMFPSSSSPSFFFIVSNHFRKPNNTEKKTPQEIEEDLLYWLRFIVSNSRRRSEPETQALLPNVTVILTHSDKITQSSSEFIPNLFHKLREKFKNFLELYPIAFTVDARSSGSISRLAKHLRKTSKTVIERAPHLYELCYDLLDALSWWRSENNRKPVIRWPEFSELCQKRIPSLRIRSRHGDRERIEAKRRTMALSLHNLGEIITFDELGVLILDCSWFSSEVIGKLVRFGGKTQSAVSNSGFITRKELEKILVGQIPSIGVSDLVRMMLKLELCYEQVAGDLNSPLLIPAMLEEGRGKLQRWPFVSPESVFVGRHLECDESRHMFLTPAFFPRLQVHLHNKIMGINSQAQSADYNLEKYLISIAIDGVNIRVELGGPLAHFVDILACSTKSTSEILRIMQQLIIPSIHKLSHGVILRESVIRTQCITDLTPPRYRKTQYFPLNQLKQTLLTVPADNLYSYQHTWSSVSENSRVVLSSGFDFARDLLSDEDFRQVLQTRYHDLHNLALELEIPDENKPPPPEKNIQEGRDESVDPTISGIAKGVEAVLQRLKVIEQEIRDIKTEIQGLRYYEHRILTELGRKIDSLVNYSANLEERKVPQLFYIVEAIGNGNRYTKRLVTSLFAGMTRLRLHFFCEFRREMHVVDGQPGCDLLRVDSQTIQALVPYLSGFMKLLTFALKIGAHFAAGLGEMIPDLSKEVAHMITGSALGGGGGTGAAALAAGAVGMAAMGARRERRDINGDTRAVRQWVVDLLRSQGCLGGKEIGEKFGLWRVRYRDDGRIAWICRRHMEVRGYDIVEVPV